MYFDLILAKAHKRCFVMSRDFLGNAKNFRLFRKCIYKPFLFGNHPNDSLLIKVIDQIIRLCIKITWRKNHDNLLFGQCGNAPTIKFMHGGYPNGTP